MKIAVVGGNLLGCATTLDLALVQEHDQRVYGSTAEQFSVTLFERSNRLGGNSLKSVRLDEDLNIEVGSYRTLSVSPGTFLADLISVVNDGRGTIPVFNRRIAIPGATASRRGSPTAAPLKKPWSKGSYHRVIRSFAAWDWRADAYHMQYSGWQLLDGLHRILENQIWRSFALAGLLWSVRELNATVGTFQRGIALGQVLVFLIVCIYSPRSIIASWQRQYSFWGTTLPMLVTHGITPAISRGSSIGFVKHLADVNAKNAATCSVSVGALVDRGGLEPYLRGSGDDYVRKFSYNRNFVDRYLAPVVGWHYAGAKLNEVSSLAAHFALLDGDFSNSDVTNRLSLVSPENATLCNGCIEAARVTMPIEVKMECQVTQILYDEASGGYRVVSGDGASELFDGIALCVSPKNGEMVIDTPVGTSLSDLLGYDRDAEAAVSHAAQEEAFLASLEVADRGIDTPVNVSACSHFAIVEGVANPGFFRFTTERRIPDLVQITYAPSVSRFERIREVSLDKPGVYTVLCGADFQSSGLLGEMFEDGAEVKYFAAMAKSQYKHNPLPAGMAVDDCMPHIVLGSRFIYAAATDKLAIHPEMDAMSAVNAASLFSKAVQWSEGEKDETEVVHNAMEIAQAESGTAEEPLG